MKTVNELLTRREAAEYLKISRRTLETWAMQGYGPPYARVGRMARYRLSDIDRWLEANLVEEEAP